MKISLSIDDGCASDLRIAEMADRYEIDTTFYWPVEWTTLAFDNGYIPLTYNDALSISRRYEVGSHTITHRRLTRISPDEAKHEILGSKLMLERLFGRKITKFCPPRSYTNEELSAFTLRFYKSQRLTKGKGLVHIHPNSGVNENMNWIDYFDTIYENSNHIELWGHSWEFDELNLWGDIERFLRDYSHSEL